MTDSERDLPYLDHLARESARFRALLTDAAPGTPVPTCPDWDADDLLWHLGEVQWFWGTVAARGLVDEADVDALVHPDRPGDRAGLLAFFDDATGQLQEQLGALDPSTERWTWSDDHSVAFLRRRQAHEALIHRLDAELVAGESAPIEAALADDGCDEIFRVMYGGRPAWGTFTPTHDRQIRFSATDTGSSWVVGFGTFTGTNPARPEETYTDEPDLWVEAEDDGREVAATVSGTAADLDCWLWHRPSGGDVVLSGDDALHAEFRSATESGIN